MRIICRRLTLLTLVLFMANPLVAQEAVPVNVTVESEEQAPQPMQQGVDEDGDASEVSPEPDLVSKETAQVGREAVIRYLVMLQPDELRALLSEVSKFAGYSVLNGQLDPAADGDFNMILRQLRYNEPELAASIEAFKEQFPGDPRGRWLDALQDSQANREAGLAQALSQRDSDGGDGSIELVSTLTLYGASTGTTAALLMEAEDSGALIIGLSTLLGLGGGLTYTWTRRTTQAEASLASNGVIMGYWNGMAALMLFDDDFEADDSAFVVPWAGATLGLVSGLMVGRHFPIDEGDVALANSGAIWGTFLAGMSLVLFDVEDDQAVVGGLLAGTDGGFAIMSVVANYVETTRTRQVLIDLGGVVGALLATGVLATTDFENPQIAAIGLTAGAGLGIGLAAFLSSGFAPKDETQADNWTLPGPWIAPARRGEETGVSGGLQLAGYF